MSHTAGAWRCRSLDCTFPLGLIVEHGRLVPFVMVRWVEPNGVAVFVCPLCHAVKRWFPKEACTPA
jgi:hypothetical protein